MRRDIPTILKKRISKGHRPKEDNVYGQWRWQRSLEIKGVKDRKAKEEEDQGEKEEVEIEKEKHERKGTGRNWRRKMKLGQDEEEKEAKEEEKEEGHRRRAKRASLRVTRWSEKTMKAEAARSDGTR